MKRIFITVGFLFFTTFAFSQNYMSSDGGTIILTTSENGGPKSAERGSYVGPHILGEEMVDLLDEFEESYVYYKETGGAYSSKLKVINKPRIYKAINKFEKKIVKEFEKGDITYGEAKSRIERLVNLGIDLLNYETEVVEKDLKKIKKHEDIEEYLLSLKLK